MALKNTKRFSLQTIIKSLREKVLAVFAVFLVFAVMVFPLAAKVLAGMRIDGQGGLIFSGQILGEGSDDDKSGRAESSNSILTETEQKKEAETKSDDDSDAKNKDEEENQDEVKRQEGETEIRRDGMRIRTETKDGQTETEIRFGTGKRIKTENKVGETETEIISGGIKVKLEREGEQIKIKAEREDGEEIELGEEELVTIEERLEKNQIRVRPMSGDRMIIQRGRSTAVTHFPLSVDLATNELIVNTPAGEKRVAVLPDQAVQNMLAANVIDRIGGQTVAEQVARELATSVTDVVALAERNGVPVYEVAGFSDQRLLGFIPVSIHKTAVVAAESGELLSTEQSLLNRLLDVFSL